MKLVERTVLSYREGTSDKVYEVDLCEVSPNRFVVNFRYGRRGTALKEGTKTAQPVELGNASRVFADLVASKVKKGYTPDEGEARREPAAPRAPRERSPEARARAVVARLEAAANHRRGGSWPVERAAWRAGELGLAEAAPHLVRLLGTGSPLRDYCIAWALGRCGDASVVDQLAKVYADAARPAHVRRAACESLLALSDERTRDEFRRDTIETLPGELRDAVVREDADAFSRALATFLGERDRERAAVLETLYLVDTETVRPALVAALRSLPLEAPWFRALRHIFKSAEQRRDAEVFGVIARRFEVSRPMFTDKFDYANRHVSGRRADGSWFHVHKRKSLQSDDSQIAFGASTRAYFRRRAERTVRQLGADADPAYVRMAVGVLLAYTDADAQPVRATRQNDRRRRQFEDRAWDGFAGYIAFNSILYANSPRYRRSPSGFGWYRAAADTGEPAAREEAFPELWDRTPAGLVHLLAESACRAVHHFAAKALRANPAALDRLDRDDVCMLLARPYEVTQRLGLELAVARYSPGSPDTALVLAVADCELAEARAQARKWIDADRTRHFARAELVAGLATASHADVRAYVREALLATPLTHEVAEEVADRLVAFVLACDGARAAIAADVADTLRHAFGAQLRRAGLDLARRLLAHPLAEAQELGARILIARDLEPAAMPDDLVRALVGSPHPRTRVAGLELVSKFPDSALVEREDLLMWLVAHPLADVREGVRPLFARLVTAYTDEDLNLMREQMPPVTSPALVAAKAVFVDRLVRRLVALLYEPEPFEGAHAHFVRTACEDLAARFADYTPDEAWRMLGHESQAVQELAGHVLGRHPEWASETPTARIADLAFHEVRSVRLAATAMFSKILHRFGSAFSPTAGDEIYALVRVLDSPWDDTRKFWFEMFHSFLRAELTAGHLIAVCDSPRADARALGRELVAAVSRPEDGLEFLTKLSEHPAADMQQFVTNYLAENVAGATERLEGLSGYFVTVLSRANGARAAKARVLAFLDAEARSSEAAARVVAAILARVSATAGVECRAAALGTMVAIHRAYPDIQLPIRLKPVEVRHAV